jgi:hypothetical protein
MYRNYENMVSNFILFLLIPLYLSSLFVTLPLYGVFYFFVAIIASFSINLFSLYYQSKKILSINKITQLAIFVLLSKFLIILFVSNSALVLPYSGLLIPIGLIILSYLEINIERYIIN